MSRVSLKAVAARSALAAAAATLAACSDAPVQPDGSAAPPTPRAAQAVTDQQDAVVAGDVLVKLKDGASLDAVLREHGLGRGPQGYAHRFDVARTQKGNERAMAARLRNDARVEWAEPNYLRQPLAVSPRLWALSNPGGLNMKFNEKDASGRYGQTLPSTYASLADADMDASFAVTCMAGTCADIVIGNIDTGVDFNNPELSGRLIAGKDWIDNDNDPSDIAAEGHGTHTAGTSAGANISAVGATGIASHVKFYAQRVCGTAGCPTSAIINALNAAASYRDANGKPMVAVNVSLGGGTESTGEQQAIATLTTNGTLVIASAGNDGRNRVSCPACDANAISVAATDWRDARTSYSNYGKGLDISAPGGNCYSNTTEEGCVFSSIVTGYTGGNTYSATATGDPIYNLNGNLPLANGYYAYMQGTSMAAPNMTSAAAVVAWATGLRGTALRDRLFNTADDKGTAGYDTGYGYGRVNVYRAVNNSATSPL
ncbi:MAG: S8 family peptidase [Gemmatimonadaceae bacterium]